MSEPEAKKQKTENTGWENHTMNISEALTKEFEGWHLQELVKAPVTALQGIGIFSTGVLDGLGVNTIAELAKYQHFLAARAIKTLSETETKDGRLKGSTMNVDKALVKEHETKTLKEVCELPVQALEGVGDLASGLLASLGVKTVGELAEFKYCRWAEAIVTAAEFEEMMTVKERKVDRELSKLS